ncbi:MAG TPA: hypothetical protein VJP87_00680 [Candidatus Acidoferrales bacterium]|nr:hypothetical protein [Candidatus Acidoferrales bacterium]
MKCEEFELIGMDAGSDTTLTPEQRQAAAEHVWSCERCAALRESWAAASAELGEFAAGTQVARTPDRVEMRVLREYRTRRQTMRMRRMAVVAGWALAGAAVLLGAISWYNWKFATRTTPEATGSNVAANASASSANGGGSETLLAVNDASFTPLPGALSTEGEDTSVVRVRMPRSALGGLGLPVNEENASEWIQVDLLVTDDGQPQAVRLTQ